MYSFADWWNGICRGNIKGPHGSKPFTGKDTRRFVKIPTSVDPRIHFAVALSHIVRPLLTYSGAHLEHDLEYAAEVYCENTDFVWVQEASGTITLSSTFQAYMSDFARKPSDIPEAIMKWLPGDTKTYVSRMNTDAPGT